MAGVVPVIKSAVFDELQRFVVAERLPLDLPALLTEFDLPRRLLTSPSEDVPLRPVSLLFERAAILTGKPCFGLEYAQAYPVGASGALGLLMAHAPTMDDALRNLTQFIHAFTSPMHITYTREAGGVGVVEWVFPLEFAAAMPQYVSFALGAVIQRLRRIGGPTWTPLKVELIHRELPCPHLFRGVFGERVRFEAAHNRMSVDPTSLALRNPLANTYTYQVAETAARAELERRQPVLEAAATDITSRVRRHLQDVLSTGVLELEPTAAALGLEPRQLQYALDQAQTSFSEELSETRRLVAEHLLGATDHSMTEIAAALGFAELSSFTRACRMQWFGLSPSKFRARVRAEAAHAAAMVGRPDPEDTGA
jgi:AraC-like DNA-binding protein